MFRQFVLTTEDAAAWRAVLPASITVAGSVEYARISEKQSGCPARLFVVQSGGSGIAYPFLLRSTRTLPFAAGLSDGWWDTFTPEYTGPVPFGPGPLNPELAGRFPDLFARYCRDQRIIAEFAHLNPWKAREEALDSAGIEVNREIVYVDLTRPEDKLWTKSLTSSAPRQAKQGQEAGVPPRRASSPADVHEFHRLYAQTMERRNALDRYHFSLDYFLAFFETLPDTVFFVLAEYKDQVVAGGLFFEEGSDLSWHLSAADLDFSQVRPVNVYVWEMMRWAHHQGKQRMLLGGGYQPDDGVFRFKANFSPLRARFCTYKRIHNPEAYAELTRGWFAHYGETLHQNGYFPAYRSTPPVSVATVAGP